MKTQKKTRISKDRGPSIIGQVKSKKIVENSKKVGTGGKGRQRKGENEEATWDSTNKNLITAGEGE